LSKTEIFRAVSVYFFFFFEKCKIFTYFIGKMSHFGKMVSLITTDPCVSFRLSNNRKCKKNPRGNTATGILGARLFT
jgi:hypothetical protein